MFYCLGKDSEKKFGGGGGGGGRGACKSRGQKQNKTTATTTEDTEKQRFQTLCPFEAQDMLVINK